MKKIDINLNGVQLLEKICRGLGGTIYLATWDWPDVSLKVVTITDMGIEIWNIEVCSLQKLNCPNVIRLLGTIYNTKPCTYDLVLAFCEAGYLFVDLTRWTHSNVSVNIANGLNYL